MMQEIPLQLDPRSTVVSLLQKKKLKFGQAQEIPPLDLDEFHMMRYNNYIKRVNNTKLLNASSKLHFRATLLVTQILVFLFTFNYPPLADTTHRHLHSHFPPPHSAPGRSRSTTPPLRAAPTTSPFLETHWPFQPGGGRPRSRSLKLLLSGEMPVSISPMTRSKSKSVSFSKPALSMVLSPRKWGERVVWSWRTCLGMRAITWESDSRFSTSSSERVVENPWNTVW